MTDRDASMGPDGLARRDRDLIRDVLARYPEVRRVTLFGSRAMGTFGRGSDIDLALEGRDLDARALTRIATELEDSDLPYKVDLLLCDDQLEPKLEAHIRRHGKPFGWESVALSDVGSIVTGKTPSTKREDFFGGSIPFVTPTDMDERRDIVTTGRFLTESGVASVAGARLPKGAVLVSCIGSDMGKSALATKPSVTNQQINSIIVSPPNSNLFVYYNLSRRREEIRSVAGGSAQPILNKSAFSQLKLMLPPPEEQHAIAGVLGALDDKIEQNRRTAQALEQLARAIFRAWFVDFEPVKAKAAGATSFPSMPQSVFDALPTRFVDSAIGPVPQGWEVGTVTDLCDYVSSGGTPARRNGKFWAGGTIDWFKTGELQDGPLLASSEQITQDGLDNSSCKLWQAGTILFALYASPTVGRLGILTRPSTSNQAAAGLIACPDVGAPYLMNALLEARAEFQRIAVGAAQQNINQGVLKSHKLIVPPSAISGGYSCAMNPPLELRIALAREGSRLAEIRDYLLPKLLSGQVRVSDTDQLVPGGVA